MKEMREVRGAPFRSGAHEFLLRWSVSRRILSALMLFAALLLLLLEGCARGTPAAPTPVEVTRVVTQTVVVRDVITRYVTPARPDVPAEFVLCVRQAPAHLDPLWPAQGSDGVVQGLLGRVVMAPHPDGTWTTEVFERVPTLENGGARLVGEEGPDGHMEVTYTLRSGLRWEDGTPVTAEDFVRAWQAARSGKGHPDVQRMAQDVADMRVDNERRFTVVLRQGLMTPLYPGYVFGPLPPPDLLREGSYPSFGPYRLVERDDREMVFVVNPAFATRPAIPQVRLRVIPDAADALVALIGGRCDLLPSSLLDETARP